MTGPARRDAVIFSAFALAFFMSYGLRAVNAVLAPNLVAEFSLSASELGALSSAYFMAFALMQLPLGIWLDRYGARRVEALLLVVAAAGCALFAAAQSFTLLWVARALIGAGLSACLMAALKSFRFWFEARIQQRLAAWILVFGTTGALVSTVPVAWLVAYWGWRPTFLLAATLLLCCCAYLWFGLPRDEEAASGRTASTTGGYRAVFGNRFLLRSVGSLIMLQGGFLALQTLWAGPWMTQVLGLSAQATAQVLMLLNGALLGSFLVLGWLAPRIAARGWDGPRVMRAAAALTLVTETGIAFWQDPDAWVLWLVLAAGSTVFTLLQTEVALSFPPALSGRAYTGLNMLLFGGAFALQWGFGWVIDLAVLLGETTPEAYQVALMVLIVLQLLSLAPLRSRPRTLGTDPL
ncbi:MAG: MFS transporter [Betaproteobacteria bacterium]|nr:MFS transporter [Betaproteobacteria bacterium]